jgi:epoxyqueuosine reductase
MTEPSNPRRPKRGTWTPQPETLALLRSSGNEINGVGESTPRRPSPFFWHPPDQHPWGDLQLLARKNSRKCSGSTEAFQGAYTYSELIPVAKTRNESSPQEFAEAAKSFAFSHEADDIGVAVMDPLYVFEGYTINQPWVIVLALAHNYERLREVPSDETNGVGVCDVGDQYARGHGLLMPWPTGFVRRASRRSVPRPDGWCAVTHSTGHFRWTRRTRQAWIAD